MNKHNLFYAILFFAFLLVGCRTKSNWEVVEFTRQELAIDGRYVALITFFDTMQTKYTDFYLWKRVKERYADFYLIPNDSSTNGHSFEPDFLPPSFIPELMEEKKMSTIWVERHKSILFRFRYRNYSLNRIRLIYYHEGFEKYKHTFVEKGYTIFYTGKPEGSGNWVYVLDKNWAVYIKKGD